MKYRTSVNTELWQKLNKQINTVPFFLDVHALVQNNIYFINTVVTDGLLLQHQDIRNHSDDYTPLRFNVLMG